MSSQQGARNRLRAFVGGLVVCGIWTFLAAPARAGDVEIRDPWERMNRGIFWFNERADQYVLEPVAKGWDFVLPDLAQTGVENFFDNLRFPVVFVNQLLQAKPLPALETTGRFLVNSTAGVAGFVDVARHIGLEEQKEDFGQTLGYWGVPTGPYLVLPLLGPSNPRDTVGLVADSFSTVYPWFIPFWASAIVTSTDIVNDRSLVIEELAENRKSAFDFYVFARNAYAQYRENQVRDRADDPEESKESEEDLYYFEDDE